MWNSTLEIDCPLKRCKTKTNQVEPNNFSFVNITDSRLTNSFTHKHSYTNFWSKSYWTTPIHKPKLTNFDVKMYSRQHNLPTYKRQKTHNIISSDYNNINYEDDNSGYESSNQQFHYKSNFTNSSEIWDTLTGM